jgi:hypothetical protein
MNLESQVCSLELAKRLKELGVKQESYFYWLNNCLDDWIIFHAENDNCNQHSGPGDITFLNIKKRENKAYSAFTVTELGELLPDWFDSCKRNGSKNDWHCRVFEKDTDKNHHAFAETEVEARAKMLIYLLENKLI